MVSSAFGSSGDSSKEALPIPRRRGPLAWTSVLLSIGFVAGSILLVDSRQVLSRLSNADARWLMPFFAVYVLQVVLSGLRWSRIARACDVPLSWQRASAEYSLSILVNQLLPTGIAGDGLRAVRHSRRCGQGTFLRVLEVLALDRLSGQIGLALVILVSAPLTLRAGLVQLDSILIGLAVLLGTAVAIGLAQSLSPRFERALVPVRAFLARAVRLLLHPARAVVHLSLSVVLTGCLLLQLYFAAMAIGVRLDLRHVFWLGPLVMLAGSVPTFFGGWGIREGASALLFASAGLEASGGVAVSLVFGACALVCALPGFLTLLLDGQGQADGSGQDLRAPDADLARGWTQAHAAGMVISTAMAVALDLPHLLIFAAALSFVFLIGQARGFWTPAGHFGLANVITTSRVFLTAALLLGAKQQPGGLLISIALLILALDFVDGWIARRKQSEGSFGAQYDMETDAVFVLALTLTLVSRGVAGHWVLLAGLWRYFYVLAPVIVRSDRGEAPRSLANRLAYLLMVSCFVASLWVTPATGTWLCLLGTSAISVSFMRSFWFRYAPARFLPSA